MKNKQPIDPIAARFSGGSSELLFWSYRYFVGRMSASVSDFAERLARSWYHIDPRYKALIRDELTREFARDDELRAERKLKKPEETSYPFSLPLGHDCDRAAWDKVRTAWEDEDMDNRNNSHG
jgi:hypothetical protein